MSDPTDYTKYTIPELEDARRSVDVERYCERAAAMDGELKARERRGPRPADGTSDAVARDSDASGIGKPRSPSTIGAKMMLSIPFFGLAGILLLPFAWLWLAMFQSVVAGLFLTVLFGGGAFGCTTVGLLLWERRYRRAITGALLVGEGLLVMLMTAVSFGMFMSPPKPQAGDLDAAYTERAILGGAISTVLLLASGIPTLVGAARRWPSRHDRSRIGSDSR